MSRERSPADHDTLSCRLSQILLRLNQGECLRPTQLAQDFGVGHLTGQVQRHAIDAGWLRRYRSSGGGG